jgi:hypothetical protein
VLKRGGFGANLHLGKNLSKATDFTHDDSNHAAFTAGDGSA